MKSGSGALNDSLHDELLSMNVLRLFTIGFTKTTAEGFFTRLRQVGVRRIVDVRLNNTGQLAGFSRRDDLAYFLRTIDAIEYVHQLKLAPTQEMLRAYRDGKCSWDEYARKIQVLLKRRQIEKSLRGDLRTGDCLLCSEPTSVQCHRRIVAEYLQKHWGHVHIEHL
jgi:uncharacterized protein (DUF488 family)